jgi:hypothetical protein
MAENRLARELEDRSTTERPKSWQPASVLPEPDKQPGYTYRWVRVSALGQVDPRNISAKTREGWEPVRREEQSKFDILLDPNSRFKDNIEIGGLLLCKMPNEFVAQRNAHFGKRAGDQAKAVDATFMRENNERMPLFSEKRSSTTFGKGK